jgi:hypothetical protein
VNPLRSLPDYEQFIYALPYQFASVARSTLTVIRRGADIARLTGEVEFADGYRIVVREKLSFAGASGLIKSYGYEVWRGGEKLYWYDSQEHLGSPALAVTHPHHKHIPPDIKHHRVPAPQLSFTRPNLPALIEEVLQLSSKA